VSVRVVYDTMVFLQAATRPDRTHATFQLIKDGRATLCVSPALLLDVEGVLKRDNVRAKFPALTSEAVTAFITEVLTQSTMFDPIPFVFTWPHHPDDDHLFNLAIHARAGFLVTWETRILNLATDTAPAAGLLARLAPDLAIVTPKQLADTLKLPPNQTI
jgi:putative PIN family toxin of toxin-antitoxin system